MREYRKNNKDRMKKLNAEWYQLNKEKQLQYYRDYHEANKEKRRLQGLKHYQDNKALYLCYSRTRKAALKQRTPEWLTDEMYDQLKQIYIQCKEISDSTGILHHVDHIVPLFGDSVSGLHVPWNLQIITAKENLSKSNKFNIEE